MSDDRPGVDVTELSFSEAMEELESVLRRIEGDEIDVDQLGRELGRAARLLEICRKKIRRAEVEVRQIVEQIEEDGADSGAATPEPPEAESPAAEPASPDDQDDIPF
ncbi:MAG: exodeoxyribonuclease VII small subunit [Acidobacteriota bacterium]|nr:exodeoxyribonuclease VII small subunit [Acidobacteriota bacterium]MDE2921703.1 exodeoxyribonuclease VII small subunit [Acidobacteriota bacterium]MDE3266618.1 exodeoxyribonuclease VII small subunit [Acidobacteriota bacterium]